MGRDGDGRAVSRVQHVERGEHEELRLEHSGVSEREVDRHLVTIEVGVERRGGERVELNGLTLNHTGLERLDAKTVKSRGSVEEHRVVLHDILKDVPYHRRLLVHYFLCRLDCLDNAALNELADDERLIKLCSHVFRQAALVHTEFGADDDDGARGVVNALTKKVLTETTLFALEAV